MALKISNDSSGILKELYNKPNTPLDRAKKFYSYDTRRSFDTILKNTEFGDICEEAFRRYINGTKVNYSTGYDILSKDGLRYEIKSMINFVKYWTFSTNYEYLKKNILNIDRIVLLTINNDDVYLVMNANAKTFFKFVKKSMYGNGTKFYYDHRIASKVGECILF